VLEVRSISEGRAALCGRLDAAQVDLAEDSLRGFTTDLELDLTELEYISSAGISVLLRLFKRLHADGRRLRLSNVPPAIKNIFHYAGLEQILDVN
jgi:anti-sigma B factor antagonist